MSQRTSSQIVPRKVRKPTRVQQTGRFVKENWWLIAGGLIALSAMLVVVSFLGKVPLPEAAPGAQSSKILAADGQLVGTLHGEENRTIVPLSSISQNLRNAVIATEDQSFYQHPGVSVKGILRAAFTNVRGGGVRQGGSTITQQYVRNAFAQVGRERTVFRKIREVTLAVKIEKKFSKTKILEFYLNTVYFGRGAYGAEAAARTYFKKPAKDLTIGESAYLAGLIRAPERFQIDRSRQAAVRIRGEVLQDMEQVGLINPAQASAARREDLVSRFKPGVSIEVDSPRAGYFVEYVRRLLAEEFKLSDGDILGGGLQIQTGLDLRMQDAAEQAVSSTLNRPDDPEAALVAMDPQGYVKAMVGGRDVNDVKRARGYNFAANVKADEAGGRQAGSAFKPFALAAFVDEGKSIESTFPGPAKITISSPRCRNEDGTPWEVENFKGQSFGTLDVVRATTASVNTIYAQMMDKVVTPSKFIAMADKTGIKIPRTDAGCALTLGTSDVTPMEMARAFSTFAARGKRPEPLVVLKITTPDGKVVAEKRPQIERAMVENVADTVNHALEENVRSGTGTEAKLGRPAAGKTGTTQNNVDAWFAGYTPQLTAVVWMGYPPDKTTGKIREMQNVHGREVTGGSFPAIMWQKFMGQALKGIRGTDFAKPKISGEVLNAAPTYCTEEQAENPEETGCVPSPRPTPTESVEPEPSIEPIPTPDIPDITPVPDISIPFPFGNIGQPSPGNKPNNDGPNNNNDDEEP